MIFFTISFYIISLCCYVSGDTGVNLIGPKGAKVGWAYQGILRENSSIVTMSPQIQATPVKGISTSMSICGYTVHNEGISFFPFIVLLVDKQTGSADIRLKSSLPKESLDGLYTFQIEAYDCDNIPHFSQRKFVLIEIKTSIRPMFSSSSYHFLIKADYPEGSKVGVITAFERPEKSKLGICEYAIVSGSTVPFTINKYGVLSVKSLKIGNTKSKKYTFNVQVKDCRKPEPKTNSVPVTVEVFDDCEPHWTGLSANVNYSVDSGVLPIISGKLVAPSLHLCNDKCRENLVIITVKLNGQNIRPASASLCKKDSLSLDRQEILCDVSKKSIDLLKMAPESMKDTNIGGYIFPSNNIIKVDPKFNNFGHTPAKKFTIMFWMKHANMEENGVKEQILCNSDGQEHNRHHFSLFLHNCKLILLFRKEFGELGQDQYKPSEWRYGPLKEVCDDKWHHYAVMYNNGVLSLQVDGEMTKEKSDFLNDKPMLQLSQGKVDTKFTVGACYHAKSANFVQYFKGHLASLKILDGDLEAINNIRCIATCGEALLLPHIIDIVGIESSVTLLSDSVIIRSHDIFNLIKIFSSLSYINTEILDEFHGQNILNRTVTIDVDIHCDGNIVSKVPSQSILIKLQKKELKKEINNHPLIISAHNFVQGYQNEKIPLFSNLKFIQNKNNIESIQSCIIRPVGKTIQAWEYIDWPIDLIINFHLTGLNNSHGIVLEGKQILIVYELILAKIYYVSLKYDSTQPDAKFAISCSVMGKMVTNEVVVAVHLKQNDLKTYYIVDDPTQNDDDTSQVLHQQGKVEKIGFKDKTDSLLRKDLKKHIKSNSVIWVVLACLSIIVVGAVVGFLIFYKIIKKQRVVKSHKVSLINMDLRRQSSTIKLTTNPLHNEGIISGDINVADDDCFPKEMPDSEDDECDECDEINDEDDKYREVLNSFPRISSIVNMRSVDV